MLLIELKPTLLEEFSDENFAPTEKFRKVYGNYCGPGNQGGDPIDDVDCACKGHDLCYFKNGRHNQECDKRFIEELEQLLKGELSFKQRTVVNLMKTYFKAQIAHSQSKQNKIDAAIQRNKDQFSINF